MKKRIFLLTILCPIMLHAWAEDEIVSADMVIDEGGPFLLHGLSLQSYRFQALPLHSLVSQSVESRYYRVLLVITSQSDWSTVRLMSGGYVINTHYEVTEGYNAPEFECWYDAHLNLIGMTKNQFDTTLVKIEVKTILYVKEGSTLGFEIQKGDIKHTTVEIYNYNTEEPVSVETFTHGFNIEGDPENRVEFSVNTVDITAGGPLRPLLPSVPKMVWAFYYPWYYKEQWFTSEALTDSPLIGPHDSSDPEVIEMHIKQAKSAGIDGFIVSWWGEDSYTDENLKIILDIAQEYNFKITIIFESLGGDEPRSERELKRMFVSFFENYGNDTRYYRIDGEPVIFVWAVESHPPSVWETIITDLELTGYTAVYVAETGNPDYLDVFDGLHRYATVGIDDLPRLYERLSVVCRTYGYLYDKKRVLWAATLCPGYDDRKIPGRAGLYQPRENGEYYKSTFEAALTSSPDWILITSFNEWWENTHIEPSTTYGSTYLEMTSDFSSQFKGESTPLQKADSLFEQGKQAFEDGNYEEALDFFQRAKEIYESIGSEKTKECDEWIQKTQNELKKGFCLGTFLMAALVGMGLIKSLRATKT
ncbi:MAG: hypothetical protein AYK19_05335 [Theionarchaea archaeon DG-70-1]|nr:MAG: hypothetical protein AYK19_05335 [Theionarchaea archaeon DG-70-1]